MFLTATYTKPQYNSELRDENVAIVRNLRNNDLTRANLILDLKKKEVKKCRNYQQDGKIIENPEYSELFNYFHEQYPQQLDIALQLVEAELNENRTSK